MRREWNNQYGWLSAEAAMALGLLAMTVAGSAVDLRNSSRILKYCKKDLARISDLLELSPPTESIDAAPIIDGNNSSRPTSELSANCSKLSASVTQCTVFSKVSDGSLPSDSTTHSDAPAFLRRGQRLLFSTEITNVDGGFTLLEVIISLGLLALIFAASFPILKTDVVAKKRIESAVAAEVELLFVRTQIENAAAAASRICVLNGAFSTDSAGSALTKSGNAIGFIIPAPSLIFHPPGLELGPSSVLCTHRPWGFPADSPDLIDIDHWLAVGVDGVAVLSGSARRTVRASCAGESAYRVALSPAPRLSRLIGIEDGLSQRVIARAINFIPLADGFLLFTDDHQIFRRRSLFSRENAPMASGIAQFAVESRSAEKIAIRIQHEAGSVTEFSLHSSKRCRAYEWLG